LKERIIGKFGDIGNGGESVAEYIHNQNFVNESEIASSVESGNANPVSSDAVYTAINSIPEPPDLSDYALKSEIPEVPDALSQIIPEDEIQPVNSVAVINYVSAQIPPAPTLTFKTEFIEMDIVAKWADLSTCWILLNVCHIEFNMMRAGLTPAETTDGYPIGILKVGMPLPSEDIEAQLAGLSGILTLRLKQNGIIYISEIIHEGDQINVSIFYTFTEYR
jgi:hypothetical protein